MKKTKDVKTKQIRVPKKAYQILLTEELSLKLDEIAHDFGTTRSGAVSMMLQMIDAFDKNEALNNVLKGWLKQVIKK